MNMLAQNESEASTLFKQVIKKLESKEDLSFVEQCVMVVALTAFHPGKITSDYFIKQNENSDFVPHDVIEKFINALPSSMDRTYSDVGYISCGLDPKTKENIYPEVSGPKAEKTYIVKKRGTNEIKIGKTIDVGFRVKTLQNQSGCKLDILCTIEKNIENMLHRQFAEFRTVGEWFDDSKGFIAAFAAKQGGAA